MKRSLLVGLLTLLATLSIAGTVRDVKITKMYCGYYSGANMCSIYFDKIPEGSPVCHTKSRQRMQIKTDDDTGKALLSLALAAYSQQNYVDISGKNTCTVWKDTEDMNMLMIKQGL